jgi:hypothetical protein
MPADEYSSWLAYFEIEPWGTYAAEFLVSRIIQTQYAAAGAKNMPDIEELMPFVSYRSRMIGPKAKTPEELLQKMQLISKQVQ